MAGMIRPHLAETVSVLKEIGRYDLASSMEALGKPRGYLLLQRTETMTPSPLSVTVPLPLKEELQQTAQEMDQVLDSLANDAYRLVASGEWMPPKTEKAGRGKSRGPASVLQVSVDRELREQVREQLPELKERAGYRVTEASIVLSYLCDELGVDAGVEAAMPLKLWEPLRDHFVAARNRGVDLGALVDGRVRQMLDGSWEMPAPTRSQYGRWSGARQASLNELYLKPDVRQALHDLSPVLSEKFGTPVPPSVIVRVILTAELGEPAA